MQECFRLHRIPTLPNRTFIVLIPKLDKANCFNQFRPISLCNFSYKVVAKILATGLTVVLDKIVSPNQGAFVQGR